MKLTEKLTSENHRDEFSATSGKPSISPSPLSCGILEKENFQMAFLEKAKKQDLVLLAEELGQKVSDKMTNIELRNIIIGSKDYEEEFVRDQLSVILEERFERESEEKIARQLAIEEEKIARQHAIQQLRWESELKELRLEIESIRSNVKRTSCAEDRKKTSSNYRISIGRAEEHVRETSPAVLMAEATIPVTTPIKEEKGMDDLRVVYVKVKGEQEMVNAVIDTGAQMPVVRPDVVEGQSINNRGSIQITSAFGEHEMGEVKDSNMELNDFRHGVVPVSKNLVNDMLICSSDYEVLIENSQMIRNPAKLREPSKKEGIISSTDSKSVCSQEVVTDLLPETQSLLNVPNGDLVAVKINGSNVQTNGQGIKESKGEKLEDLIEKLRKAHEIAAETAEATQNNYASYYNLRSREKQFKVGDKVLVLLPSSTHKLMKTWIGPATIIEITRPYSAKVELDDGGIRELHFNKLRPYIARVGQVGLIFDQDSDFGDLHYAPTDMAVSSMGGCYRSHKQ
ncbi:CCHC-type domain-containing protein [Trichonephila clavipes]|nr:CCHC-type domain-containing protein [Trichonephila clavipes]